MEAATHMFSGGFAAATFILFFVCLMLPVFYLIYYVFKKDFNPLIMLIGIVAFVLFDRLVTEQVLIRFFAPSSAIGTISPQNYAIRLALSVGVIKALGIWVVLLILSKRYITVIVPASFALGYSVIDMIFLKGSPGFAAFTQATAINNNGLEAVVSTVDLAKQDAFRESIAQLAATPASLYIWATADAICAFAATVCIARLLWYSIEGGTSEKSRILIPICVVIAVVLELPGALYDGGAFSGYALAGIAYYVLT
ncbi:MAG: YhfC family intramembrane metalloprotease, partial [Oscillospiraceae bacterium]|nr:YhfC family intramembrane metalloprotease [Oscillospiraceae bacterium]